MLVDDELNADVVHGQGAAEGACFAHQYRALLAQRAVDGLDEAGLAAAFGAGPMRGGRQHVAVGLPLVGKIPSTRAVFVWQGRPQAAQGGRPPAAQHPGHDPPRVSLDGQPEPDFALFAAHEGPHLIEFEYPGPTWFGSQLRASRHFFLPA